ncbi:Rho-related BTB domain-containing protein 1 [Striga asiatica]|uniref:Rho-related BTB domain-containing protein 1 n=1 Tax=Striga asiatica TaxID=4170 RepID=A0A5A7P0K9_STRAF|nr:Rho-related BTB domain-containing protein 1 [Striga asiatica]
MRLTASKTRGEWPHRMPARRVVSTSKHGTGLLPLSSSTARQTPTPTKSTYERNSSNPDSKRVKFLNSTRDSLLSRRLIFDSDPENSWDELEIGSPVVKRFIGEEEERWCMWQWPVGPEPKFRLDRARRLQQRGPLGGAPSTSSPVPTWALPWAAARTGGASIPTTSGPSRWVVPNIERLSTDNVIDLSQHLCESLVDVDGLECRGLHEKYVLSNRESLGLLHGHGSQVAKVGFITDQHYHDVGVRVAPQLFQPPLHIMD